jgi:hypothetical protein
VLFSVHLKATMMKVSDPIIFGHVVAAFFPTSSRSTATTSPRRRLPTTARRDLLPKIADAARGRRDQAPPSQAAYAERPGAGDGRLRQGHHQPARAERRHRRRLDAGDDPQSAARCGRRRAEHDTKAVIPDSLLRRIYQDRHRRLLQVARRLRPEDDGLGARTSA